MEPHQPSQEGKFFGLSFNLQARCLRPFFARSCVLGYLSQTRVESLDHVQETSFLLAVVDAWKF